MLALALTFTIFYAIIHRFGARGEDVDSAPSTGLRSYLQFFYASFLKPHTGDGQGYQQQQALESFYKCQAGVYDATRKRLLRGREEMLALVSGQLRYRAEQDMTSTQRVWVDVGVVRPNACHGSLLQDMLKIPPTVWRRNRIQYRSHVGLPFRARLLLGHLSGRSVPFFV